MFGDSVASSIFKGTDDNHRYSHMSNTKTPYSYELFLDSTAVAIEVIASNIRYYLGPDASVGVASHPENGGPAYHIKPSVPVTIVMMDDLKADSDS